MTLEMKNVSVTVDGLAVLSDVSLTLTRGTMNVLLGATLAGKTSLMRLMAGLDVPGRGQILIDGRDVRGVAVRRRSVAMVYQQFVNYPSLTVYENIASPLRVARVAREELDARVRRMATVLGIEGLLDRMPSQISGGQQQRTAIARAMVKGADLVLLDEPLANLDYKLREELREELPRILSETNSILVYATTEPLEALQLGGNTAALYEGRLTQFGATPEVYHDPGSIEAARVFSDPPLNELRVSKTGAMIRFGAGQQMAAQGALTALPDGTYTLGFRTDIVSLGAPWPQSLTTSGTVVLSEISGSESFVHVETALGRFVCVEAGVSTLQPGQAVTIHVDADRIFVFDQSGARVAARGH